MPPRLPVARNLPFKKPTSPTRLFYCPSCSIWRLCSPQPGRTDVARLASHPRSKLRRFSTIASSTAINAPTEVPVHNRELHQALQDLKHAAASYANLSRVQLALRGVESRDAAVRVAVLSMGEQSDAKKLARLLLADPLTPTGAWEKQLEQANGEDGKAILLRYGDEADIPPRHALTQTIFAPSRILEKYNLEILITTINVDGVGPDRPTSTDKPSDAVLMPAIQTPASSTGRVTLVTYPVHKALLLGDGLESLVAYGRFAAADGKGRMATEAVKLAVQLNTPNSQPSDNKLGSPSIVDIDLASGALDKFRESIANSVAYERGWLASGMPQLVRWLETGTSEGQGIKPAVKDLISDILNEVEANIALEDKRRLDELVGSRVPDETKQFILEIIRSWSEFSHTELRDQLDIAFASRNWRKLAWWKLFWRVDDVSMIASELLQRRWLIDAEKGIIWVAGRVEQAGYAAGFRVTNPYIKSDDGSLAAIPSEQPRLGSAPPEIQLKDLAREDILAMADREFPTPEQRVWPQEIPVKRDQLLMETIPTMQALAQRLVLETLSTVSLSSALTALTYLSLSTTMFEAGSIAAAGVVFSLRRMQQKWERARESWEADVREDGRKTLQATETKMRTVLDRISVPKTNVDGVQERKMARDAIEKVREALNKLEKRGLPSS